MNELPLINVISVISTVLPLIVGLYMYRWLRVEMKILLVLFFIASLVDGYSFYQAINRCSNVWILHFYTPLEYSILVLVFSYWQKEKLMKRILRLSIPIFILIFVLNKMFIESTDYFDYITASVESIILLVISVYVLYSLHDEKVDSFYKMPQFWVATAVLIYFAGNTLCFSLGRIIPIWIIPCILNIIANLLYTGGFLCCRSQSSSVGA